MAPTIPRRTQTVLLAFIVCLAHGQSANKAHTFDVASMKPARPVPSGPILITKTGRGRGAFGSRGCPGTDDLVDFNGKALTAGRDAMRKTLVRSLACLPLFLAHIWAQGLDVMFVLETSPGTEQQIGLIRPRDLKEGDRAGVIVFTRTVQFVQPLTENREDLAKALQLAGIRISIGVQRTVKTFPRPSNEPVSGSQDGTVDLYGALRQACREFGDAGPEGPKHVIIVLAASEDPRLGGNLDSLKSLLAVSKARLFAIAITRGSERAYSFPVMTAQFLNQLAKDSGGRMFRGPWDLKSILAAARKP